MVKEGCFTDEDPRFRIWHNPDTASFEDLLAVLISHGYTGRGVLDLSRDLAKPAGNESGLFELDAGSSISIKGLGPAKATVILAAIELARRKFLTLRRGDPLIPEKLAEWVIQRTQGVENEFFYLMTFNRQYRLIRKHLLSRGNPDGVQVYFRNLLKVILNDRCTYAIVAHNHPQESARPGSVDLENMQILEQLLEPVGVKLLDQYIAGMDGVFSCNLNEFLITRKMDDASHQPEQASDAGK